MKRIRAISLSLLTLLSLLLLCTGTTAAHAASYCNCPDAQTHAQKQEAFDRILQQYKTMGASIAIISGGRIVDTFQYGTADRDSGAPVTDETYFRIASVTKMMSAVGIMKLVETGVLSLDEPIEDHFDYTIRNPYFKDSPITLRQIMTHTASLKDGYHYAEATKGDIEKLRHVLDGNYTRNNYFSMVEPGTKAIYSNFGGGLLGAIVEQVSAQTIDELMQETLYRPLSIYGGYHVPCLPYDAQVAKIYNERGGSMTLDPAAEPHEHFDPDAETGYVHSAGAGLMTAEGMAKMLIALAGDGSVDGVSILAPETVSMMREMQNGVGSVTGNSDRGLNLNIITDRLCRGRTLYGHQGKAYGMICAAYFDPTDGTGVVLLTNGCDTSTVDSVAKIARAIITEAYTHLP